MTESSGRFDPTNDPIFVRPGICHTCVHLRASRVTCDAFPDGIPEEVIFGDVMHIRPYPGDNGIVFKAAIL